MAMFKETGAFRMLSRTRRLLHNLRREFVLVTDLWTGYFWQRRQFEHRQGYPLDLRSPKTFNEKIVWKKLFDRRAILPLTGDKYTLRGFVLDRLGAVEGGKVLIPLLHVTEDPADIPFASLEGDYIVKISYGSGWNIMVKEGEADPEAIIAACLEWLEEPYGRYKNEWAYQKMRRRVVVEELLKDESGEIPKDYKFFMFDGHCGMIQVDLERFRNQTRSLFTAEWECLAVPLNLPFSPHIPRPPQLSRMLELASRLSEGFDFVRVDLYAIGPRIYVGEMTHYPGSGDEKFDPVDFDIELGKLWTLPTREEVGEKA